MGKKNRSIEKVRGYWINALEEFTQGAEGGEGNTTTTISATTTTTTTTTTDLN